jgi:diadenylate cyclase
MAEDEVKKNSIESLEQDGQRANGNSGFNDLLKKQDSGYETLVINPIINEKQSNKPSFLEVLGKLSPGKSLRTGLDDILNGRTGALIVVECDEAKNIFEGGFKVNCKFTSQRLAELSKMDGAIILSSDMKRILFANALLIPKSDIPTEETGTRHKSAERTAKQTGAIVIAVSERRRKITLYYDNKRYVLQNSEDILRRATETLQILEKQKEILDENLKNFNILEITNLVSYGDVCLVLQRIEMVIKMTNNIKRYLIELGNEGTIIKMRINELTKGIIERRDLIIKDYALKPLYVTKFLENLSSDSLLDLASLSRMLFEESPDKTVFSRGYRLLNKLNLMDKETKSLVSSFENLQNILNADEESLRKILKNKTNTFRDQLVNLKEQIMIGKKI